MLSAIFFLHEAIYRSTRFLFSSSICKAASEFTTSSVLLNREEEEEELEEEVSVKVGLLTIEETLSLSIGLTVRWFFWFLPLFFDDYLVKVISSSSFSFSYSYSSSSSSFFFPMHSEMLRLSPRSYSTEVSINIVFAFKVGRFSIRSDWLTLSLFLLLLSPSSSSLNCMVVFFVSKS